MPFTDEDLRRLKEVVKKCLATPTTRMIEVNYIAKPDYVLAALIARLEAAERIVNALDPEEVAQVHENFIAWRKEIGND